MYTGTADAFRYNIMEREVLSNDDILISSFLSTIIIMEEVSSNDDIFTSCFIVLFDASTSDGANFRKNHEMALELNFAFFIFACTHAHAHCHAPQFRPRVLTYVRVDAFA